MTKDIKCDYYDVILGYIEQGYKLVSRDDVNAKLKKDNLWVCITPLDDKIAVHSYLGAE